MSQELSLRTPDPIHTLWEGGLYHNYIAHVYLFAFCYSVVPKPLKVWAQTTCLPSLIPGLYHYPVLITYKKRYKNGRPGRSCLAAIKEDVCKFVLK